MSKTKPPRRHEWTGAIITAERDGVLKPMQVNILLRLSEAIYWNPTDPVRRGRPGLYWSDDKAFKQVGISRATFYRHQDEIVSAGFLTRVGGNLVPTIPSGVTEPQSQSETDPQSQRETPESQSETESVSERDSIVSERDTFSVDTFNDSLSVDTCSDSIPVETEEAELAKNFADFDQMMLEEKSTDLHQPEGYRETQASPAPTGSSRSGEYDKRREYHNRQLADEGLDPNGEPLEKESTYRLSRRGYQY